MPWMKDPEGNIHEVNWFIATTNEQALGWVRANKSEIEDQKRKRGCPSGTSSTATSDFETTQIAQNAAIASSLFDNTTTESRCDDSGSQHSSHSDTSSSHSHHSSHDYSAPSSHDSGSGYDCSSSSDFSSGGDF